MPKEEDLQLPMTREDLTVILQAQELIMTAQQNNSKMLLAILEILAAPGATPSVRELLMCSIAKTEALEIKAELTPQALPEPQPIENETELYNQLMAKLNQMIE